MITTQEAQKIEHKIKEIDKEIDSLIVSSITEKFWAKLPGIYIKVEELNYDT